MEDLEWYLNEVVDPTIDDFQENPRSVRHAFLACVAVFHGVDYLAHPRAPSGLRQKFGRESADFEMVDRVAHAFKHVVTGHPENPRNQPLRADNVILRPGAGYDVSGAYDLSRYDDPVGGVTLDSDRNIDLLNVVKRARDFLRAQLT